MNLQKLGRQIKREAKAHPAKTGVLALVAVVAIWFWAPLIIEWTSHDGGKPPAAAATVDASTKRKPPTAVAQPVDPALTERPWQEVDHWMQGDALLRPANALSGGRDPFHDVRAVEVVSETKPEVAKAAKIDPKDLNLVLTSTLVGSGTSIATINGRAYAMSHRASAARPEKPVTVVIDQQGKPLQLTLISIEPNQVLLDYEGQRFQIQIKEKKLNDKSSVDFHNESGPQ